MAVVWLHRLESGLVVTRFRDSGRLFMTLLSYRLLKACRLLNRRWAWLRLRTISARLFGLVLMWNRFDTFRRLTRVMLLVSGYYRNPLCCRIWARVRLCNRPLKLGLFVLRWCIVWGRRIRILWTI